MGLSDTFFYKPEHYRENEKIYIYFFILFSFLFIPKHLFSMANIELLRFDLLSIVYNIVLIFIFFLFAFLDRKSIKILSITAIVCLIIAVLGKSTFSYTLINIFFCSLLMSKVETRNVYLILFFNMTIWILAYIFITILFSDISSCRFIDNNYCYPTLGLKNPNSTAFIIVSYYYILIGFIYNFISRKLTIFIIPFFSFLFYLLLSYFGSRTQSYLVVFSAILFFSLILSKNFRFIVRFIIPYSILFSSISVYVIVKLYDSGFVNLTLLNVLFSGRLYLLGTALNDITMLNFFFGGDPTKYLPLDNFTVYSIVHGGLVSLLFFIFLSVKSGKYIRKLDIWSLVIIVCAVLNSISESYSFVPFYNLGIMFIFSSAINYYFIHTYD